MKEPQMTMMKNLGKKENASERKIWWLKKLLLVSEEGSMILLTLKVILGSQ